MMAASSDISSDIALAKSENSGKRTKQCEKAEKRQMLDVVRAPRHRDQSFRRIVITGSTPS
jgi:hypothetical protein